MLKNEALEFIWDNGFSIDRLPGEDPPAILLKKQIIFNSRPMPEGHEVGVAIKIVAVEDTVEEAATSAKLIFDAVTEMAVREGWTKNKDVWTKNKDD